MSASRLHAISVLRTPCDLRGFTTVSHSRAQLDAGRDLSRGSPASALSSSVHSHQVETDIPRLAADPPEPSGPPEQKNGGPLPALELHPGQVWSDRFFSIFPAYEQHRQIFHHGRKTTRQLSEMRLCSFCLCAFCMIEVPTFIKVVLKSKTHNYIWWFSKVAN